MSAEGCSLNFLPIGIGDKPLFDRYFRQQRFDNSHFNFTTRFIWRHSYGLKWALVDECLCFIGNWDGAWFTLPPIGQNPALVGAALDKLTAHFRQNGWPLVIRDVERSLAAMLEEIRPGRLLFREDRDNFDYVYNVRALIELRGRLYHAKKNHVNTFRRLYSGYQLLPLTAELARTCLDVETAWARDRDAADQNILSEQEAIDEALRNWDALQLVGSVIQIAGKVVAFTFGEKLNEDTAVVHVEKAHAAYKGIYAALNREFCAAYWQELKYVNRQEDLGVAGLRKAKLAYHPVKLIEKYIAVAR